MKKIILLSILMFLGTSCNSEKNIPEISYENTQNEPLISEIEPPIEEVIPFNTKNLQTHIWIDWLDTPWWLVFLDEQRALVTQRDGKIFLIENNIKQETLYYQAPSIEIWEWWLFGIEKDPDFAQNHFIYIMYSYYDAQKNIKNKVVQLKDIGKTATENEILLENIPWDRYHNGGRIKFWPDKKLYIATWDASNPQNAQNLNSLSWKILRINTDGSIPADNPFENSLVYSYGHRNPQWIAFEPNSWNLFISSHGPTGEFWLRNRDRVLDFIIPWWNYGWPEVTGYSDTYQNPIIYSENASLPPAGMTFWNDRIFITTLKSEKIIIATLEKTQDSWQLKEQEDFLTNTYGRLRDAVVWLDNHLYILTSNKDGRWNAKFWDDKILIIQEK